MGSPELLFLLALNLLLTFSGAQNALLFPTCSDDRGNFTANSNYEANLNTLLSNFSTLQANDYGFYNLSVGQNSDQVNGIALCRGDVNPDVCVDCIKNASIQLPNSCPNRMEAAIRYDFCTLRYSNRSILGVPETNVWVHLINTATVTDPVSFNASLNDLLLKLIDEAASGDSRLKFATGNSAESSFQPIYALVQCTPDITQDACNSCLRTGYDQIPQCCGGRRGSNIISTSCFLRFEMYSFYNASPDAVPPLASSPPPFTDETTNTTGKNHDNNTAVIVAVVVPTVSVFIIIICVYFFMIICVYFFMRARKTKEIVEAVDEEEEINSAESLQFDFGSLRTATNNFSDENKLGQGGFGAVYKGSLSSGKDVAVKRLSRESGQGDLEFKNEVLLVAKLQHRNLVKLLGFSLERTERLLIYEFVPNASLDRFIFDPRKREKLDWEQRFKIIEGIARGILYLHQDSRLRIIHRDLKASNVLLDADMNPKIADFGLARLFSMDETQANTNRIVGTYGYMAPEYAMHGQFSVKSDVFSFGVLILEIISGRKNICFQDRENVEDLLSYAWKNWREGTAVNLIDPTLKSSSRTEMTRCIHIGLLCVQENVADRPTMGSVIVMLSSFSITLPVPSQPAFFRHSTIQSDFSSSSAGYVSRAATSNSRDENLPSSKNEASITDLYPR